MKTNVQIELTDDQRSQLANLIDGKTNKRKAGRKEVVAICQQHIGGLLESMPEFEAERMSIQIKQAAPGSGSDIYRADPEDVPLMTQPNNPGYVRGWNLVKRQARL